ncbi:MAG: hypothetical protein WC541_00460 [Dehalococcoidia bacterium]
MTCEAKTCPFRTNRPLIVSLLVSLGLSILFSAFPFAAALALDKSGLALAVFMAWYFLFPPLVIFLATLWINARQAYWLRTLGAIWLSLAVWFLLQYLLSALAGLSVIIRLLAMPAVFTGNPTAFLVAGLILLAAGIVVYILGPRASRPAGKPALAWTALALLLVISLVLVPISVIATSSPAIKRADPASIPSQDNIFRMIGDVYTIGERRPGSQADHAAIEYLEMALQAFGFKEVYVEKSNFDYWEPVKWGITVQPGTDASWQPESFYVPYSGPAAAGGSEAEVVYLGNIAKPDWQDIEGKIGLVDISPTDVSWDQMKLFSYMAYEPENSLKGWAHPYPIGWMMKYISFYKQAEARHPAGIIGILRGYPEMGKFTYYAPYDGELRSIPGMYLLPEAGDKLKAQVAAGKTVARIELEARTAPGGGESANVYGVLPGRSADTIIIHSHHDSPWRSGVEDSSGVGMVLALAGHYAQLPVSERPFTMIFLFTGGHMVGGATNDAFIEKHRDDIMKQSLYDIAIEHISDDYVPPAQPMGGAEPRGVFITENPVTVSLYAVSVADAGLARTLVFPTGTPLGVPTDAQHFGRAGLPVVSMISGPVWLFDDDDTLERVHKASLEPMARLNIDFVNRLAATPAFLLRFNITWALLALLVAVMSVLAAFFVAYRRE